MKPTKIIATTLLLSLSSLSIAAPSINDMQSCQGLLDFIDNKLASAPSTYQTDDVKKVRKGINGYNQYIQREIVSPGLLQFNSGDKGKTKTMQQQVDAYKKTLVDNLEARYPQNRLFTDHAIAVNDCAKKSIPSGQELEDLKTALTLMVALAKLN